MALIKDLRVTFGSSVDCWLVNNDARVHDVRRYPTAVETAKAILKGTGSGQWTDSPGKGPR
jgi:hypothetical protein